MRQRQKIALAVLILAPVLIGLVLVIAGGGGESGRALHLAAPKIGRVTVVDVIYNSEPYVTALRELRRDKSVAGVILRIDSPGGAVAPSQEIYREVLRYREDHKPLIVSMGNVAASGGYYIASPAQRIFANPGTITGSIGVIFQFPKVYKLLDKVGVDFETLTAGRYKDVGSPHREMSPRERELLQALLDDTHEQFIQDIAQTRELGLDSIRALADGRIFTGRQAMERGLVDSLGGYVDALAYLKAHAGLPERTRVVEKPARKGLLQEFFSGALATGRSLLSATRRPAGCYFLSEYL